MAAPGSKILKVGIEIGGSVGKSLDAAIRQTRASIGGLGKGLNDIAGAGKAGLGRVLASPLWQGAAAGAAGIAVGLQQATRTAMAFEKAMDGVVAKLGDKASGGQAAELEALAKRLGRTTQYTATQAAEGMDFLAMAGFGVQDMLQATDPMLKLAAIGNMDLAATADIVSNVLTGMGLSATESARMVDVMAKAATNGNVDVRMIGETFKYAAPIMKQAGVSIEQAAAAMAILGDAGIQGSEAGTGLRGVLLRLAAPPKEAAKALQTLGVSTKDAQGNLKTFPSLMTEIGKKLKQVQGSANRLDLAEGLFGKLQIGAGMTLLDAAASGAYDKRIATVADSNGAANVMYAKMTDNLTGAFTRLGSAWEGLQLALAGPQGSGLQKLVDGLAGAVGAAAEFIDTYPEVGAAIIAAGAAFVAFVAIAPAVGAALGLIQGAGAVLAGLKIGATIAGYLPAIIGVGQALLALATGPIGLTVLAVVGIGAAMVAAYQKVGWFRDGVNAAWAGIKAGAAGLWAALQAAWPAVVAGFGAFISTLQRVGQAVAQAVGFILGIWGQLISGAAAVWGGLWNIITGVLTLNSAKITAGFQGLYAGIGQIFGAIGKVASAAWGIISAAAAAYMAFMKAAALAAVQAIGNWFLSLPQRIAAAWKQLKSGFGKAWQFVWEGAQKLGTDIINFFLGLPGRMIEAGKAMGRGLLDGVKQGAGALWNTITGAGASSPANNVRPLPRAYGGPTTTARPYLVGERQPEVVTFGQNGYVHPSIADYLLASSGRGGGAAQATSQGQAPSITIGPGAVQVTVSGCNAADVEMAVQRALRQFQVDLESSYRSLLSD